MITISKQYSFDASHQLWREGVPDEDNVRVFGKCSRLHGHTYTLEVEVTGSVEPGTGMILNYFDLDKIVKPIVEELDHFHLNNVFGVLTTAENMVALIAERISGDLDEWVDLVVQLRKVTLSETPKTKAVWHADL